MAACAGVLQMLVINKLPKTFDAKESLVWLITNETGTPSPFDLENGRYIVGCQHFEFVDELTILCQELGSAQKEHRTLALWLQSRLERYVLTHIQVVDGFAFYIEDERDRAGLLVFPTSRFA